jgi:hypothetical protein
MVPLPLRRLARTLGERRHSVTPPTPQHGFQNIPQVQRKILRLMDKYFKSLIKHKNIIAAIVNGSGMACA